MPITPKTNTKITNNQPPKKWQHKVAHWIVERLYGQKMHISGSSNTLAAANVIFWYNDHGMRKFLMLRDVSQQNPQARFAGCLETSLETPMAQTLFESIEYMFGKPFARTIESELLEEDKVKAAPTLSLKDKATGEQKAVQGLVWLVQITKSQIELCKSLDERYEVIAVPEFAMTGQKIADAHKVVFEAARPHLTQGDRDTSSSSLDRVTEALEAQRHASKTLH